MSQYTEQQEIFSEKQNRKMAWIGSKSCVQAKGGPYQRNPADWQGHCCRQEAKTFMGLLTQRLPTTNTREGLEVLWDEGENY